MPHQPPTSGVAVDISERRERLPDSPDEVLVGFDLRINGAALPVPVVAYEVVPGNTGTHVTVTIRADSVTVGSRPSVATAAGRSARTWGTVVRDPREGIPGWTPEVPNV